MEHLINLNFAPGGLPATVHVSQYDDTIRQLRFQLWFGRSKVEVPSGASVRVDIKKPDGHIVLVNGTVNSSDRSIVTVPTTKQMTAVPGGSRGTLVVSSTGDKRISSAIFILQVHRDPVEDGDASDSDLSMLQDAIDQTAANATAAQAAATAAQQAASSFTTDTTLSVSGKAADAAETGRQFGLIKADLGDAVSYDTAQEKKYSERTTGRKNIGALGSHLGAVNAGQVVSVDENGHAVLQKIGISPECNDALFNLLSSIEYHNNDGVERRNNFMAHFADKKIELPSAYQQVLYLEATGTQYIVTSILSQIPFECDIEFYTNDGNPAVVGTADSSDSTSRFFLCGVNHRYGTDVDTTKFMITNRFGSDSWNNEDDIWIEETGKYHVRSAIEYAASGVKSYIKFGDQYSSRDISSAPAVGYPICFFFQRNSSDVFAGLLFSAKFAKSGVVLFNGVPCVRKSDGKPGLYDTVNGVFYTNSGTGEFLYGSEI